MNGNGKHHLQTEKLVKTYGGRRVVNEISLYVEPGEIVGLLGPNGAGKTTTFYMVVGETKPTKGRIFLNGEDITGLPHFLRARKGISYLPQEPSVFRRLSVEENLLCILQTLNISAARRRERLRQLLTELGIMHLAKSKAYTLSGGERRRAEIARALVISPSFILLDEPFAGIDPIAVADIQKLIKQLREKGIGILITDHNVRETFHITDRAYIISDGRILRSGTPAELEKDREVREVFLGNDFRMN
ncbi:MAG TPA: LPS export ABC transporter ATP-binding protein [Acidobacteriota bacterium]|nr:LPS export ABC transporter ATP-binding protein [Acidobacteriota bacterium]